MCSFEVRIRKGAPMFSIIASIIKENTSEQLDETFDELTKAISMRSVQGIGTDEGLSEMLATLTAERNNRPPGG
jgi:hypothetical protein